MNEKLLHEISIRAASGVLATRQEQLPPLHRDYSDEEIDAAVAYLLGVREDQVMIERDADQRFNDACDTTRNRAYGKEHAGYKLRHRP